MTAIADPIPLVSAEPFVSVEPWRRRLLSRLLYGRDANRSAKARARVGLAIIAFVAVYSIIAVRLVMFAVVSNSHTAHRIISGDAVATARPDILDRNGEVLATDVPVPSLYAEPRRLIDVDEAEELLTADLPDLDATELRERLSSKRGFVWLKRDITPEQQAEIYRQGLPGIGFLNENKRDYPNGAEVSHLLGAVNIDNQGIAGIEKWLDGQGLQALHLAGLATDRLQTPVQLAVDLRVQHALRDELVKARAKYSAIAAAGVVLNVRTGEIVAMVSEPDFDPNNPREALDPTRINRLTTGVYEMGSTFKAFTVAMALDSGKVSLKSTFDAHNPMHYGKFDIHDFEPQQRALSVPEIFTYSSNIGAAHIAMSMGIRRAQGIPEKIGAARSAAYGVTGKRTAYSSKEMERTEHHHHCVRPWPFGCAAASGHGRRRTAEWRYSDSTDVPQAHRSRSAGARHAGHQARNQRDDALPDAAQCREGHSVEGRRAGLLHRRQDWNRRQGGIRPLFEYQGADRFHGGVTGGSAALSASHHAGRAAPHAGIARLQNVGLERGADRRCGGRPDCAAARHSAATRSGSGRSADTGLA
jgi:hypothetical protein